MANNTYMLEVIEKDQEAHRQMEIDLKIAQKVISELRASIIDYLAHDFYAMSCAAASSKSMDECIQQATEYVDKQIK